MASEEDRQFGPYRLVTQIATGGMAEIHLAKTRGIGGFEKLVALKMIHPNFSSDEHFIHMLIDEAKISVQLQHVNIAHTFDLGRVGGTYYIAMEYVDGWDLFKILRRASELDRPMSVEMAVYVAKEVLAGLDYAHGKRDDMGRTLGIIHRDVSPQNVLISRAGEVKLVDFGIAKATMRARQTAAGVIKGKYYYMSPEQAWGDPLDRRTDIFSAGILAYEMLTGQMLYLEEDMQKLLDRVRKADIPPLANRRPDVPRDVERAVMRALAKKPDLRWQQAADFGATLEAWLHAHAQDFSAQKLAAWVSDVMRDKPLVASGPDPIMSRAEFTDENSIIFALGDVRPKPAAPPPPRPPRPARPAARAPDLATTPGAPSLPSVSAAAPVTATKPIVSPRAAAAPAAPAPRAADRVTAAAGAPEPQTAASSPPADPTLDQTMASGPPAFVPATNETIELALSEIEEAGEHTRLSLAPTTAQDAEAAPARTPDPTRDQTPDQTPDQKTDRTTVTDEPTHIDAGPIEDTSDEDPTRLDVAGLAGRTRAGPAPAPPPPPATPAESAPPPRRTRRTPGAGIPVERAARRRHEPGPSTSQRLPLAPPAETTGVSPPPLRAAERPERVWPPASTPAWGTTDADDSLPFKLVRRMPWRRIALYGGAACAVAGAVALAVAYATRPPPPPEFAAIEVISIPPGARLAVDGRDAGSTPVTLDRLPIGSTLKLRLELDRHEPWERGEVVGAQGGKIIASLRPVLGELVVDSAPLGAEVFLNNKSLGVTPLNKTDMDPYTDGVIEVRKAGFKPVRRPMTWSGQRRVELRVELLPARE